jgi:C4-dicarboxylate-specific signal transduction histidine kinase
MTKWVADVPVDTLQATAHAVDLSGIEWAHVHHDGTGTFARGAQAPSTGGLTAPSGGCHRRRRSLSDDVRRARTAYGPGFVENLLQQLRELQMQLAHANRVVTMGQLGASVTHEVNQPVASARNNISAALHFLDKDPPDLQEVREALVCAAKDADRIGAIVDRMRALMQKASSRSDHVDINEAVLEVIELMRGETLKHGVSVKTNFAKDLPVIAGDRVQLQQVVLNLILNALQEMGADSERAREVLITTSQTDVTDLYVGVQDTGPGLSPETLSRLFEPFYTTKLNGMGMGLAISRSIIEAHGGRLLATACHPRGALFQFTIPNRPA